MSGTISFSISGLSADETQMTVQYCLNRWMNGIEVRRLGPLAQRMTGEVPGCATAICLANRQKRIALRVHRFEKKLRVVSTERLLSTAFFISLQQKAYSFGNAFSAGCHDKNRQDAIPSSPMKLYSCSESEIAEFFMSNTLSHK